jgi:hypothetical protein
MDEEVFGILRQYGVANVAVSSKKMPMCLRVTAKSLVYFRDFDTGDPASRRKGFGLPIFQSYRLLIHRFGPLVAPVPFFHRQG